MNGIFSRMDAICILDSSGQTITSRRYNFESNSFEERQVPLIPARLLSLIAGRSQYQTISPVHFDRETGKMFVILARDGIYLLAQLADGILLDEHKAICILENVYSNIRKYYCTPITESVIKTNFNTICPLLDEALDGGLPFSLELNSLEATVMPPSMGGLVDKLAAVVSPNATASFMNSLTGVSPEIWWRRSGVFHPSNEFYVEVSDRINCVMAPSGKIVAGSISGSIRANCRLSGIPELLLSFKDPDMLNKGSIAFHPCVRLPRWIRDKKLSFTPPNGEFVIADYTIVDKSKPALPFSFSCGLSFDSNRGNLSISLSPKLSILDPTLTPSNPNKPHPSSGQKPQARVLEDVVVKVKLPRSIASTTLITHSGSAIFDSTAGVVVWTPGSLKPESSQAIKLEGTLLYTTTKNAHAISQEFRGSATVEFTVRGWNASGVRVDTVDVSGIDYTPFKGCRYSTCGGAIDFRL